MSNPEQHLQALSQWLTPHELMTDAHEMAGFCLDQRQRFEGKVWAVVQPHSVEAIQKTVQYCAEHGIPITPQGGNTSMCGGATPSESVAGLGIIVSLSKLNRVREVNLADNCMTVEAGRVLQQVQQAVWYQQSLIWLVVQVSALVFLQLWLQLELNLVQVQ